MMHGTIFILVWTEALWIQSKRQMRKDICFRTEKFSRLPDVSKERFDLLWTHRALGFSICIRVCWHHVKHGLSLPELWGIKECVRLSVMRGVAEIRACERVYSWQTCSSGAPGLYSCLSATSLSTGPLSAAKWKGETFWGPSDHQNSLFLIKVPRSSSRSVASLIYCFKLQNGTCKAFPWSKTSPRETYKDNYFGWGRHSWPRN